MTGLEKCCTFFKELALSHKVPAQMNVTREGIVRIHLDKSHMDETKMNEIVAQARRRGMRVDATQYWVTIYG